MQNPKPMRTILSSAVEAASVILIVSAIITGASQQAMANPEMAKKTGQPCAKCHTAPPALSDYGQKYKDSLKK
jgi:hypothetical protein